MYENRGVILLCIIISWPMIVFPPNPNFFIAQLDKLEAGISVGRQISIVVGFQRPIVTNLDSMFYDNYPILICQIWE